MNPESLNATEQVSFTDFCQSRRGAPTLVLLGSQGSGTNLLVKILREVFGIFPVLDRSLIFDAGVKIHERPSRANVQRQFRYVMGQLFPSATKSRILTKHYSRMGPRFRGIETWFNEDDVSNASEFVQLFYTYADYLSRGQCNAIKSDDLWNNLAYLPKIITKSRLILIVRDPRDIAASITSKNFGPCHMFAASKYTKLRLNAYGQYFEQQAASKDLVIRYEDLLAEPRSFCEDFSENYSFAPLGPLDDCLDKLKIRASNFDKWKQLSPDDLRICETVLKDEITKYNYEPSGISFPEISAREKWKWAAVDGARRIPQKIGRIVDSLLGK